MNTYLEIYIFNPLKFEVIVHSYTFIIASKLWEHQLLLIFAIDFMLHYTPADALVFK